MWLRLVRTQATQPRSNRVIVPRDFLKQETAATAAMAPPEQPAGRRHNKRERCSRDICVVRCQRNFLRRDPFDPAELLQPPPKVMTRIKPRWFWDAHNARGALRDLCPTNRASK